MHKAQMKKKAKKVGRFCVYAGLVSVLAPVALCIAPIWILAVASDNRSQRKRRRKAQKEVEREKQPLSWPAPLGPRKRSLSIPAGMPSRRQRKSLQLNSGLLKLPFELRLAIYELVLETGDIHVVASHRNGTLGMPRQYQLKSYWDSVPSDESYRMRVSTYRYSHGCVRGTRDIRMGYMLCMPTDQTFDLGIMNLLLTCRTLYNDILSVLHNDVTFHMDDINTIHIFSRAIPSSHFNAIRSLHLNFRYIPLASSFTPSISRFPKSYRSNFSRVPVSSILAPSDGLPDVWHVACDVVAKMEGLRKLNVQLCHSAFQEVLFDIESVGSTFHCHNAGYTISDKRAGLTIKNEGFVFEPLLQIAKKDMQLFVVEVDWPSGPEDWEERDTGFELMRVGYRDRGW